MKKIIGGVLFLLTSSACALPSGFVYLHEVNGSILQDMRYANRHNFVGRPIQGYDSAKCILSKKAALALSKVQQDLEKSSMSLKVYDCYRPVMAVEDFIKWSTQTQDEEMKKEFYPDINKTDLFKMGYLAEKSGHSRGSTVDVTIVSIPYLPQEKYRPGERLFSCVAPYLKRFRDNSVDMGTGFDCMDTVSNFSYPSLNLVAYQHRILLRELMLRYGFASNEQEWWHFTLQNEPYPMTYFNFKVR